MSESEKGASSRTISSVFEVPPTLTSRIPNAEDINPPKGPGIIPTQLILLTVNDEEFLASYAYLQNVTKTFFHQLSWVFFGVIGNNVPVSLIRCLQGPTAAAIAVQNAIKILRPKGVVCSGYCGALNLEEVKLGDVVLSTKLAIYSHVRVTSSSAEVRATTPYASTRMRNLLMTAALGWKAPLMAQSRKVKVHCQAEIVSGPQLVVSTERRRELLALFPEAIAIEMEGEGVYSTCHDLGVEWAVIKGVSNYADDTKSQTENWKLFSSAMAASVVNHMFSDPEVLDTLPHYSETVNYPKQEKTTKTISWTKGGMLETGNSSLKFQPGCLSQDTEITMIQHNQHPTCIQLVDRKLVNGHPILLELHPEGLKLSSPGAELTFRFPRDSPSSETFITHGSHDSENEGTKWEALNNDDHAVTRKDNVVKMTISHSCFFCIFYSSRNKLPHILSILNHSFYCYPVGLYRRTHSNLKVSVVLYSQFVKDDECKVQDLISEESRTPYNFGDKGPLRCLDTHYPIKISLQFPDTSEESVIVNVDEDQLDRIGMVIDKLPEISSEHQATGGKIFISQCLPNEERMIWTMYIDESTASWTRHQEATQCDTAAAASELQEELGTTSQGDEDVAKIQELAAGKFGIPEPDTTSQGDEDIAKIRKQLAAEKFETPGTTSQGDEDIARIGEQLAAEKFGASESGLKEELSSGTTSEGDKDIAGIREQLEAEKFGASVSEATMSATAGAGLKEELSSVPCEFSTILNNQPAKYITQLQQWLGDQFKWRCCYRASRDGWDSENFHTHCDGVGPTVTLIKVHNYMFGGYTDQSWAGDCVSKSSHNSFLFSLHNKDNLPPFVAPLKPYRHDEAIYCNPRLGPIFGGTVFGGADLFISLLSSFNYSSFSFFGFSYQPPFDYNYNDVRTQSLLAGSCYFTPSEIEVFH